MLFASQFSRIDSLVIVRAISVRCNVGGPQNAVRESWRVMFSLKCSIRVHNQRTGNDYLELKKCLNPVFSSFCSYLVGEKREVCVTHVWLCSNPQCCTTCLNLKDFQILSIYIILLHSLHPPSRILRCKNYFL